MIKLLDVIGEKLSNIGILLFFILMINMILLAYIPFETFNRICTTITLAACFAYSIIVIYRLAKYHTKKRKKLN